MKAEIEFTKKEKRIAYVSMCVILLTSNVICWIAIGVEITEYNSIGYNLSSAWAALSTFMHFWIMFKRK